MDNEQIEMENVKEALLVWLNESFQIFKDDPISDLSILGNPKLVFEILEEMREELPKNFYEENEPAKLQSMSHLKTEIKVYYSESIGVEIDPKVIENFHVRYVVKDIPDINLIINLVEWILGIAVQSERKAYYLDIIKTFNEDISNTLVQIVYIVLKKGDVEDQEEDNRTKDNHHGNPHYEYGNYMSEKIEQDELAEYSIRIVNLERENAQISEELSESKEAKLELLKKNIALEDNIKTLEQQLQEQTYMMEMVNQRESSMSDNRDENMNLYIQVSELKGRLKVTESLLSKAKEDKEIVVGELKEKLNKLNREYESLQEKAIKYDHLVNKMEKEKMTFTEFHSLKLKLNKAETTLKEQEERIKVLRNYDTDKTKLLKKIEDLNAALLQEKQKIEDVIREKKSYLDMVMQLELDKKSLQNIINDLKSGELDLDIAKDGKDDEESENANSKSGNKKVNKSKNSEEVVYDTSLTFLEMENKLKTTILELETRLRICIMDKDNLQAEKKELLGKVKSLTSEVDELSKEKLTLGKKAEKYKKSNEENLNNLKKITELTEKNHELLSLIERVKLDNLNEINDLNNKHKNAVSETKHQHQEESYLLKQEINTLTSEKGYIQKELKSLSELLESKNALIEEYKKKVTSSPTTGESLKELESKIDSQNVKLVEELKAQLAKEEENCKQLKETNLRYKQSVTEYQNKIELISIKEKEYPVEEFDKMKKLITQLENEIVEKTNAHAEELDLMSSMFHGFGIYAFEEIHNLNQLSNLNLNTSLSLNQSVSMSDRRFEYHLNK